MNTTTNTAMAQLRSFLNRLLFFLLACNPLAGQSLHQHDDLLKALYQKGAIDSFILFAEKECALAKQVDSFELWIKTQTDIQSILGRDAKYNPLGVSLAQKAVQIKWREPRNPAEAKAYYDFLYFQSWRLQKLSRLIAANGIYLERERLVQQFHLDTSCLILTYKPLGNNYTRLGDNEKALAIFEKALNLSKNEEDIAAFYNNIALAHTNSSNFNKAASFCLKGLAFKMISPFMRAQLTATLAKVYKAESEHAFDRNQERPIAALKLARQSLNLYQIAEKDQAYQEKVRDQVPDAQLTAGLASLKLGNNAEALKWLSSALKMERALKPAPRDLAKFELAYIAWCQANRQYKDAMEGANRVLTVLMPSFQPTGAEQNPDPALFYQENSIFEALQAKSAAAESFYGQTKSLNWLKIALDCHDLAWQAEMKLREALLYQSSKLYLQQGIRDREESALRVARQLYELTHEAVYASRALRIAERSKANLLLDAIQDNLIRQKLSPNDPIFSQLNALRGNMAFLDQDSQMDEGQKRLTMDALRSQATLLEAKIAQDYPRLSSAGFLEKLSDFGSGFSMLAANETALEYFVEDEWLHCFVLNARGIVSWEKTAFPEEVRPFLAFFKNPNAIANAPDAYKSLAYKLAQLLLPPQAQAAQKLCIIPDGLLCFVPFEALLTFDCPACNLRNAPYLIRSSEVHYAFSLSTLARQKEIRPNSRRGLLAYAPVFQQGERGLAPLTSGKEEWQSFGFVNSTERIGGQASAASFLTDASKYSILHLSTHVSAGEQPRIEFYDRSFFLPEVYALPLNAELVVLSACETGLGVEQKGEGVMSLARAFAQAGAPGIISSLWSVNDKSTSTLFNVFYSQLRKGIPASASLRNAKLQYLDNPEIRSSLQTPYYWAGFVAVGDDRSVALFSWYWGLFPLLGAILVWIWIRKRKKDL